MTDSPDPLTLTLSRSIGARENGKEGRCRPVRQHKEKWSERQACRPAWRTRGGRGKLQQAVEYRRLGPWSRVARLLGMLTYGPVCCASQIPAHL